MVPTQGGRGDELPRPQIDPRDGIAPTRVARTRHPEVPAPDGQPLRRAGQLDLKRRRGRSKAPLRIRPRRAISVTTGSSKLESQTSPLRLLASWCATAAPPRMRTSLVARSTRATVRSAPFATQIASAVAAMLSGSSPTGVEETTRFVAGSISTRLLGATTISVASAAAAARRGGRCSRSRARARRVSRRRRRRVAGDGVAAEAPRRRAVTSSAPDPGARSPARARAGAARAADRPRRAPAAPPGRRRGRPPAAGRVQRKHELAAQALAERLLLHELLELRHELGGSAELEVDVDELLDRPEPGTSSRARSASAQGSAIPSSASPRQSASASR